MYLLIMFKITFLIFKYLHIHTYIITKKGLINCHSDLLIRIKLQ
jgi:hypothetical protein